MSIINLPLNLDLASLSTLTPNRDSDGVFSAVVEDTRGHREGDLVADVGVESAHLVAVDKQKHSDAVAEALLGGGEGRAGWGCKLEGDSDVQAIRDVEIDGSSVGAYSS